MPKYRGIFYDSLPHFIAKIVCNLSANGILVLSEAAKMVSSDRGPVPIGVLPSLAGGDGKHGLYCD